MSVQSLDIISVNLWQILISLANLLIVTFILKHFLFKRVQAVLSARQEQVSKIYGEAEESRNTAVSMKQEYEARLASAREEADGLVQNWLVPNAQKNLMEPLSVELAPHASTAEDVPHEGEEFGFVLEGKITLILGKKKYVCHAGESFYYSADRTHKISNESDAKASFLWISSPPTF